MNSVFLVPHVFAGQTRKRTRDVYDDEDGDVLLLDEQRFDKRPRNFEIDDFDLSTQKLPTSLPFRLSDGQLSDSFDPSLLTISPPESDESASSSPANEKASSTYSPICPGDVDMADQMNDGTVMSNLDAVANAISNPFDSHAMPPPPARPVTRPARLNPESLIYNPSGGRLPTPIHGHFLKPEQASQQASQQQQQREDSYQHPLQQANFQPPPTSCHSFQVQSHSFSAKRPSNIKVRVPSGARMLQQPSSHMLPSPISEGDHDVLAGGRLARLSVVGEDAMDVVGEEEPAEKKAGISSVNAFAATSDGPVVAQLSDASMAEPMGTDQPAKAKSNGHERRRSLTVPSEKRRFCMGYRDDCEKCRLRVPGHFSHFLS